MTTTALIIIQPKSIHRSIIDIRSEHKQKHTKVLVKENKHTKSLEIDSITQNKKQTNK